MSDFTITFDEIDFSSEINDQILNSAARAVNTTAEWAKKEIQLIIESELNFPKGYLNQESRLTRSSATTYKLNATVTGRDRATSLSRFASGDAGDMTITVRKGRVNTGRKTFRLGGLNNDNVGLGIRLPNGKTPNKAYKPLLLRELTAPSRKLRKSNTFGPLESKNKKTRVWLLYGPSVQQSMGAILRGSKESKLADTIDEMLSENFAKEFGNG